LKNAGVTLVPRPPKASSRSDKTVRQIMDNELTIPKDGIKNGSEWHLEFTDDP
jgi:hypothetical protein